MPDVEVLATPAAKKVLEARPGRELPVDVYDNLAKRLSDVGNRVEPKGPGFYGVDLNNGYRSIFTFNKQNQPVLVYVGDHAGYEKISREISNDADKVRSNFLKDAPEKVTISSKKAVKSVTFEEFRHTFLQTTGKDAVLAEEAAKAAAQGGRFMKGIKGGAKVGGKVFKVAAVGIVAAEILGLTNKAEAAQLDGRLPQQAVDEYKHILAGQAATVADPTFVLGEMGVQAAFSDWAKKYIKDPKLEAELRPSSILESLGMPMPTVAENKRSEFYQTLPAKDNASLPPDIRELVKAKEEIHKAVQALVKEKSGFWNALAASAGGYNNDAALYPDQMKAIEQAQEKFNALYQQKMEAGKLDGWQGQNWSGHNSNEGGGATAAPARPAQSSPGRK